MNGIFYDSRCNELYHYGVLGMKWGIRKARKNGTTYTYKSHGQKKWEKKLAKAQQKGKDTSKAERKLAAYKTRDSRRQSYVSSRSTGRLLATKLVLNLDGADAYRRARASGASVGKSYINYLLSGNTRGMMELKM